MGKEPYIITMKNGRQYCVKGYHDHDYGDDFLKFENSSGVVTDRFPFCNIEHIDVKDRGRAELIGRVNSNGP